jgi:hypothetical protein
MQRLGLLSSHFDSAIAAKKDSLSVVDNRTGNISVINICILIILF